MANPTVLGADGGAAQVALPTGEFLAGTIPMNADGAVLGSVEAPLEVNATFSPSGTQDVNLAELNGVALGATVPVSGTVTATGPLTDAQLRAVAVPVSGTVTVTPSGTQAVNVTQVAGATLTAANPLFAAPSVEGAVVSGGNPLPTQETPRTDGTAFVSFLGTDGANAGTMELTGNYSVTNVGAYAAVPVGKVWEIFEVRILLLSSGTLATNGGFGTAGGLATGMTFEIIDTTTGAFDATGGTGGTQVRSLMPGTSKCTGNVSWQRAFDLHQVAVGNWVFAWRPEITQGRPLRLTAEQAIRVLAVDNQSASNVTGLAFWIRGWEYDA